jgi:hypothetical protein
MDYWDFVGAIMAKTAAQLKAISDPHTRSIYARLCTELIEEERLVATFLTCPQCNAIHLRPARLQACIAWAREAEEVLTILAQTPCQAVDEEETDG